MSSDLETAVREEIEALHRFFVEWAKYARTRQRVRTWFHGALRAGFSPDTATTLLTLDDLAAGRC